MSVTIDQLKDLARRLKFDMTPEQYQTLKDEFETIIRQMELIGQIDRADTVTPMTFPMIFDTVGLREDIPEEPLKVEEVTQNAKEVDAGQIKVKKVVG